MTETWSVAVVIGDRTIKVTSDGTARGTAFEGDARDIKRAKATALNKRFVRLGDICDGRVVQAGYDSPLALTAALYAIAPQSTYLLEAPDEVWNFFGMWKPSSVVLNYEGDESGKQSG